MGFKTYVGDYEPHPRWYTFYEDGQVFEDIPRTGLAGFNREASKADSGQKSYWGRYTFANGAGSITKPGVAYPEVLQSEGADRLKIDSFHFYRCQEVNGLRLRAREPAWPIPTILRWIASQRVSGRSSALPATANFPTKACSPPSSSRATRARTLPVQASMRSGTSPWLLRFSDGRVKQLAITAMLGANAAASNETLFISRSAFHKRK